MLNRSNNRDAFAVDRNAARSGMRNIAIRSAAGLLLAGTALVPVAAQTLDLGGVTVARTDLTAGGPYTIITNGILELAPAAANITFGGQLTDGANPFGLIKTGTNSFTLNGLLNDYTGDTTVNNGMLIADATNTFSQFSRLAPESVGIIELNGFSQTVSALTGGGTIRNNGAAATLTVKGTALFADSLFTGALNGNIALLKTTTGIQTLAGANPNTYNGGTTIEAGTISFNKASAFGTGDITFAGNGTSRITTAANVGAVANNVILSADGAFLQDANSTFAGVISGDGTLIKEGVQTLTLVGDNSYTGGTRLNAGRLGVGSNLALGTGDVVIEVAQARLAHAGVSDIELANNFLVSQTLFVDLLAGETLALSGAVSGTGLIITDNANGTLALLGDNSGHSGGFAAGLGSFGIGSDTGFGTGSVTMGLNSTGIIALADDLTIANQIGSRTSTAIDTNGFTLTLDGIIRDLAPDVGSVVKNGAGVLILNADNTYTGGTTVTQGVLQIDGSVLGDVSAENDAIVTGSGSIGGTLSVVEGAFLSPGNSPGTISLGGLSLGAGATTVFELQDPGTIGSNVNDLIAVTGNISLDGTASVTILDGFQLGTFTVITYTGTQAGTFANLNSSISEIEFSVVDPLTTPGQIRLLSTFVGGSLFWDGGVADSVGDNVVTGGDGTWSDTLVNWTIASGAVNLTWLNGVNASFTELGGNVLVDGAKSVGDIEFTVDGYALTGDTLNLANATTAIEVTTGTASIDNIIAGASAVSKTGAGTLVLNGANTYSLGTALDEGTIRVNESSALGTGSLAMADGTVLATGPATPLGIDNNISIAGTGTIDVGAGALFLSGDISGDAISFVTSEVGNIPIPS